MHIGKYSGKYDAQIAELILSIQNDEYGIGLTLEEQPDLLDIHASYQQPGGEFWLALDGERVVGTVGLMSKGHDCAVLKKFFVAPEYRSQKLGLALYNELLAFAKWHGIKHIILDTPSVAKSAHRFYERSGFRRISSSELPVEYSFPDRDCLLYMLDL